jgi:hypothetical protein
MTKWRLPNRHGFGITLAVLAAVLASTTWPSLFNRWGSFETKNLIVPLIQVIMFGMGTTLSLADFGRVMRMPWAVLVGVSLQYLIMPLLAFSLTKIFGFRLAAGLLVAPPPGPLRKAAPPGRPHHRLPPGLKGERGVARPGRGLAARPEVP